MSGALAMELKALIVDWAGTVVDYGSTAPVEAFLEAFQTFGIEAEVDEARAPMGLAKRDHIKAMGEMPRLARAWHDAHGRPFRERDADAVLEAFVPLMLEQVRARAELIPGAAEAITACRQRGLKIGSTTGYTRDVMAPLLPLAAEQGFAPDAMVCAGETAVGRPAALMMYRNFVELAVWPASACVKVDDTPPGIGEGLAAGAWTIGVALTGNLMGLASTEEAETLPVKEFQARHANAIRTLQAAGAHYVVDSIADVPAILDLITGRLARGERP